MYKWRLASLLATLFLLTACGGGSNGTLQLMEKQQQSVQLPAGPAPEAAELESQLREQLTAMGIDPDRAVSAAPTDGFVFDLQAIPFDPDGPGPQPSAGMALTWTEVLLGDLDQNGEVGLSDVTPIAQQFGATVLYDDAEAHSGITWWPQGDPEDDLGVGLGLPPLVGSGAYNWRQARIDGDRNGEINAADLTSIARHYGQRLDGYRVYRKGPSDADFQLMPNPGDPLSPVTVERSAAGPKAVSQIDNNRPVRYSFTDLEAADGNYEYIVRPYDSVSDNDGVQSLVVSYNQVGGQGVEPTLIPSLIPSTTEGLAPLTVGFDASQSYALEGEIARYEWDFDGDGNVDENTGIVPLVEHTYTQNARIEATLIITSNSGETARASVEIAVASSEGNAPPKINLDLTTSEGGSPTQGKGDTLLQGTLPLTVQFNAAASSDLDGGIVMYRWDFDGDNVIDYESDIPTVTYTFTENSTFKTTLYIIDNQDGTDTEEVTIVATSGDGNWPPRAAISAVPVKGSPPLDVQFDAGISYDPDGIIVKYEWDLNDDGIYERDTGASSKISNAYNESQAHNIWLRVTDDAGATAIARQLVIVNNPPLASLTVDNNEGNAPFEAQFDGSGSIDTDIDDQVVSHDWDFDGDGTFDANSGTVGTVKHTYHAVGTYNAVLRVTDKFGESSDTSISVTVNEPPSNIVPTAQIDAFPTEATEGDTIQLDATLSNDIDGDIIRYEWDFDGDQIYDQVTYTTSLVQYAYEAAGTFDAYVRVTDNLGGTGKASVRLTINGLAGNQPPVAEVIASPNGGPPPVAVQFDASGCMDPDGTITKFEWDLDGDGSFEDDSGTTPSNSKVYSENGVYNVMVRIWDDEGASAKALIPITVGTPPTAVLATDIDSNSTPPERIAEDPAVITLDASGSFDTDGSITDYSWDINNDGLFDVSTGMSPFLPVSYNLENVEYNTSTGLWEIRPAVDVLGTRYYPAGIFPGYFPSVALVTVRVRDNINATATETISLIIVDDYDEFEDNESYSQANHLEGNGTTGEFIPSLVGGDTLTGIRRHVSDNFINGAEALTEIRGNLGFLDADGRGYNGDDNDYFSFTLSDGGHVTVDMLFDGLNSGGADLNLRLLDSDGLTVLAESLSTTSNEHVEYDFRDAGTYYVRCNRFLGARADYTLQLRADPIQYYPENDVDQENGSQATADPYGLVQQANLPTAIGRLGGADTRDWYSFDMVDSAQLNIRLLFTHAVGDLDIELRGPNGELLAYSATVTDNEQIYYTVPAGISGTGFVKVEFNSGGETNYALSIGYPPPVPQNLQASQGANNSLINVAWSPGSGGNTLDGYELYAADSPDGPFNLVERVGANTTSYIFNTTEAHPWWFKVRSYRNGSLTPSDFSNTAMGYSLKLLQPSSFSASDGTEPNLITLSWEPPASGPEPDKYLIKRRKTTSGTTVTLGEVSNFVFEFTDNIGAPPDGSYLNNNQYYYYVYSVKEHYGESAGAAIDLGYPAILSAPYSVSASDGTWNDKVLVSWYYNGEAPDGFKLYRTDQYTGQRVEVADASGAQTRSWLIQTKEAGTYYIRAYKEGFGMSPYSSGNYGYSVGVQPPVSLVGSQVYGTDNQLQVSWAYPNDGPKPNYYQFDYGRTNNGGVKLGYGTTSGTSLTLTALQPPAYGSVDVKVRVKSVKYGYPTSGWAEVTVTLRDLNNGN